MALVSLLFFRGELDPFLSLAVLPDTLSNSAVGENVYSLVSLFASDPVANISSAISPHVDTKAVLFVIVVVSVVHPAV